MGIDYEIMLLEEMNWEYPNIGGSENIIAEVKKIVPSAKLIGQSYGMLIFDAIEHRMHPSTFIDKFVYDRLLYRADNSPLEWKAYHNVRIEGVMGEI